MTQPLQFIHAHALSGTESAPYAVGRPQIIAVSEIVRIFIGPRFVMVENIHSQTPFNGAFGDLARLVRKLFPSVELQTEDGPQLVNLHAVSAVLLSDTGMHEVGLTSSTILRNISPSALIDALVAVAPIEKIKRGRDLWHLPRHHVIGLDNSNVFVRGGHQLKTTEPIDAVAQRLSTN